MRARTRAPILLLLPFSLLATALFAHIQSAAATATVKAPPDLQAAPARGVANEYCLGCHGLPDQQTVLPSGEPIYLSVDPTLYSVSAHGRLGYACVQCHTDITTFPHPEVTATSRREFSLQMNDSCGRCHFAQYEATRESVHQRAIESGNIEAAVCSDCHGAHNIGSQGRARSRIPKTCERCHSQISSLYLTSAHGAALIGEGNPDVPSCIDCHGEHTIEGPSTGPFHLFSPQICARCHADEALMSRYGVSTNVFQSFVADFHGSTVILFERIAPDQETNKPVCIDCHGVHDMRSSEDPDSTVIKENLLRTCQKCHPDATADFPGAWLSHYEPSAETWPIVFYVNQFYRFFIPGLIGGMLIFVSIDGGRRLAQRLRGREADHG